MYTFFKCTGEFLRIDDMLDYKTSFNKFKKLERISTIFFDHSGIKLEINYEKKEKKTKQKNTQTWKISNVSLNNA